MPIFGVFTLYFWYEYHDICPQIIRKKYSNNLFWMQLNSVQVYLVFCPEKGDTSCIWENISHWCPFHNLEQNKTKHNWNCFSTILCMYTLYTFVSVATLFYWKLWFVQHFVLLWITKEIGTTTLFMHKKLRFIHKRRLSKATTIK